MATLAIRQCCSLEGVLLLKKNKLLYLERKPHQPKLVFMQVLYPGRIGEWRVLVFVEGGKPENPEKTLGARKRTSSKLNLHMTLGHIGGRQALSPLRHPCSSFS